MKSMCIALFIFSFSVVHSTTIRIKDKKFPTPAQAIIYYMDALAQGRVDRALMVCAIDEWVNNYDPVAFNKKIRGFSPFSVPGPPGLPVFRDIHKWERTGYYVRNMRMFYFSLFNEEELFISYPDEDGEKLEKFYQAIDISDIGIFHITYQIAVDKGLRTNQAYMTNLSNRLKYLGAQDHAERVVIFKYKKEYFAAGFTLAKYDGYWKIIEMGVPLSGISPSGALIRYGEDKPDPESFLEMH